MRRPLPLLGLIFAACFSPLLFAQQPDEAQANQPPDNTDLVTQIQQLRADVERLSQQVDRLNGEVKNLELIQSPSAPPRTTRTRSAPARSVATPAASASAVPSPTPTPVPAGVPEENIPITVLVFRDGKRVETRNYAIVGESLWIYTEQESKKYRLEDLDVDATKKVNSDRGVSFQVPPAR